MGFCHHVITWHRLFRVPRLDVFFEGLEAAASVQSCKAVEIAENVVTVMTGGDNWLFT